MDFGRRSEERAAEVRDDVREMGEDEDGPLAPMRVTEEIEEGDGEWNRDDERMCDEPTARNEEELVGERLVDEVRKLTADEGDEDESARGESSADEEVKRSHREEGDEEVLEWRH